MKLLSRYRAYILPTIFLVLLLWGSAIATRFDPYALLRGIPSGVRLLMHMLPPDWAVFPELLYYAFQTVQIAFAGTVFGVLLAMIVGMLAANNVNKNKLTRELARGLLSLERALPDLIVMLFFVAIVGLGAFPGVMGLTLSSLGMLGKLFADSIEEIDPRPVEAIAALGATRLQIIWFAMLPQVWPALIANSLFRFEVNIRTSVFLGAVGAGGIGLNLVMSMRMMRYQEAMAAIVIILIMVMMCEKCSGFLRKKVCGSEVGSEVLQ